MSPIPYAAEALYFRGYFLQFQSQGPKTVEVVCSMTSLGERNCAQKKKETGLSIGLPVLD